METRKRNAPATLSAGDFKFVDTRIISISAERYESPSEDGSGTTIARMDGVCPLPSKEDQGDYVHLELTMELVGFQGQGRSDSDRSFSIETRAEYLFKSEKRGYFDDLDAGREIRTFIVQAFPLQMERMRRIAQDMGFTGVSPNLGIDFNSTDITPATANSGEGVQLPAPAKPPRSRKRAKKSIDSA